MKQIPQELQFLKRSFHVCGITGILWPVFAIIVLKEKPATASVVSFILLAFAAIHLNYLRRLEKNLSE